MTDGERPRLAALRDIQEVYQPAEDSQLLAQTASDHIPEDALVLDVGTGSGYVAEHVHTVTGATVVGVDVNPQACKQARNRGVPTVRGDLLSPFRDEVFDVVCFNPPYLPTPADAEWGDWMERALSGGEDGRAVIDPFLDSVGRVLRPDGVVYVLISSLTGEDEVRNRAQSVGFDVETVAEESHPFEKLLVLRLSTRT